MTTPAEREAEAVMILGNFIGTIPLSIAIPKVAAALRKRDERIAELNKAIYDPEINRKVIGELKDERISELEAKLKSEEEVSQMHCDNAVRLEKENARLREALKDIESGDCDWIEMRYMAKAALHPAGPEKEGQK